MIGINKYTYMYSIYIINSGNLKYRFAIDENQINFSLFSVVLNVMIRRVSTYDMNKDSKMLGTYRKNTVICVFILL